MKAPSVLLFLTLFSVQEAFLLDEHCPHCHWNDVCNTHSGQCQCYDGFTGNDCSVDCGCEGHRVCDQGDKCKCDIGWKWSDTEHKCVWDCSCNHGIKCIGPGVCGCAHACAYGTCWNGQCECWSGYKDNTCSTYDPNIMSNQNVDFGVNLGGLSYWSPELKFVDVTRQSQEWITERLSGPGAHTWDTHEHDNVTWRDDGYPSSLPNSMIVGKLVLRGSAGVHGPQGNFTLLYNGDGELSFKLAKYTIHYNGKGRMVVEFHESSGGIFLQIMRTNPSNPIHNIRLILPGFEDRAELFPFYPPFLESLVKYSELRFMDFFSTNSHEPEPTTWSSRREMNFHTQTGRYGAAIEYAIQLCNILGTNPWFNQPHAADDDFVRNFATMTKLMLRPDLKVSIEYSNEVWNGIFRQTKYTQEEGMKLGLDAHAYRAGMMYYNKRSAEVIDIWKTIYGSDADRLVPVWAWQTGYQDYTRQAIEDLGTRISRFKALAITAYFDCDHVTSNHNITSMSDLQVAQLCKDAVPKSEDSFKHYMEVAKNNSVKLLMYEGGPGLESSRTHDDDVTSHAIDFNRHNLMEDAVTDILEAWYTIVKRDPYNTWPGGLFNYFTSVSSYSKYGSWGMMEYTGQNPYTSPKYRAVHKFINRHFNNNHVGPKCSFITVGSSKYGCFKRSDQKLVCAKTENEGQSWSFYPLTCNNGSAMVLDGYDTSSHVIYARCVDAWAVNMYLILDSNNVQPTWIQLNYDAYHRQLAAVRVIRRQTEGEIHSLVLSHIVTC